MISILRKPRCSSRSTGWMYRSGASVSSGAARRVPWLLGREFRIDLAQDDGDEFYLEDLIGFAVETETFGAGDAAADDAAASPDGAHVCRYGVVSDYYDSELNPLFELEIDGRRVLVPAVEEFIAHIDFEARTIRMVLPAGLTELE